MLSECVDSVQLRELAVSKARQQTRVDSTNLAQYFTRLATIAVSGRDSTDDVNDSQSFVGLSDGLVIDVRFANSPEGHPCIHIGIDGCLILECQRCLQPVEFAVNLEARLTILSSETEISRISEPFDSVVMTVDGLNLTVIIEDEILSTLPIAPIHGVGTKCAQFGSALYKPEIEAVKPNRPFAGLAPLLGAARKDRDD
jgi:uncharacterized metal-binding protein YceD (DUF177 family)